MKNEMKKVLIKDIITAVTAWIIGGIICCLMSGSFSISSLLACGMLVAGVPFGWRWLSKIIVATSITMVVIKGIVSIFLGWIAIFIVIIGDIIAYVFAEE